MPRDRKYYLFAKRLCQDICRETHLRRRSWNHPHLSKRELTHVLAYIVSLKRRTIRFDEPIYIPKPVEVIIEAEEERQRSREQNRKKTTTSAQVQDAPIQPSPTIRSTRRLFIRGER